MKSLKTYLSEELREVELHVFADLHIGDPLCDMASIKERVNYIQNTPNAFVILNGDIINNALKSSVSDVYSETLSPIQALEKSKELFAPIAHKILCITTGNHERRTYNLTGIDPMKLLAIELGIPDKHCEDGGVLFLRFGRQKLNKRKLCYIVYVTHGSGGGSRPGGKVNKVADLENIIDADVYIHAHTHLPVLFKQGAYRIDNKNSQVVFTDKLFVNCSSSLNYGGYGEIFGYKPSSKAPPVIYLNGEAKYTSAKL